MRKTLRYYIYLAMNSVNILSQRNAAGSIISQIILFVVIVVRLRESALSAGE
jgi:hypothetical protein